MGGSIVLIKQKSPYTKHVSFIEHNDFILIEVQTNIKNKSVIFLPVYLKFNFWERVFQILSTYLLD